MSADAWKVERVSPGEVRRGDVIWAHDDCDWFVVHAIRTGEEELRFLRADGSLAEFPLGARLLRVVTA